MLMCPELHESELRSSYLHVKGLPTELSYCITLMNDVDWDDVFMNDVEWDDALMNDVEWDVFHISVSTVLSRELSCASLLQQCPRN